MVEFKLVIGDPKSGRSVQKVLSEDDSKGLIGLKIGDTFKGEKVGMTGYEFVITGGSDYCGFAMRKDVSGSLRKKIHLVEGVGLKKKGNGIRQRKRVASNTISDKSAQINVKVLKAGKEPLEGKPAEEAAPAEEKPAPEKSE